MTGSDPVQADAGGAEPEFDTVEARSSRVLRLLSRLRPGRRGLWWRVAIGVGLLSLALWVVLSQRGTLESSFDALRHAHPGWVVLLLALPLGNVLFTALTFAVLTNRYGRVPLWEMVLLMLSAGLLNYLPLRPGMIGRLAYHRQVHGIRAADSAKVMLVAMLCSALGLLGLLAAAQVVSVVGWGDSPMAPVLSLVPAGVLVLVGAAGLRAAPHRHQWRIVIATGWRWGDMLLWAARYLVVFQLVGAPISWTHATVLALVSQAALVVPLFGNGLGLREWGIGVASGGRALSDRSQGVLADQTAGGITADLVNRAAELLVLVPTGAIAGAILAKRARHTPLGGLAPSSPSGAGGERTR